MQNSPRSKKYHVHFSLYDSKCIHQQSPHWMARLEWTSRIIWFQFSCQEQVAPHQMMLPRAPLNPTLTAFRAESFSASLGSPCQGLITLWVLQMCVIFSRMTCEQPFKLTFSQHHSNHRKASHFLFAGAHFSPGVLLSSPDNSQSAL